MNYFTQLSIDYANQRSYLDDLFHVYPTIPEGIREIDAKKWEKVANAFEKQNNELLITELLKLKLFPIKDSYVGFLRLDKHAIQRNPATIDTVFNEEDYYKFIEKIEYFAKLYFRKFGVKPDLIDFNNFIQDNNYQLWRGIKAIRFQDTPDNHERSKRYLLVNKFPYKKR
jgi:hypothetical protein